VLRGSTGWQDLPHSQHTKALNQAANTCSGSPATRMPGGRNYMRDLMHVASPSRVLPRYVVVMKENGCTHAPPTIHALSGNGGIPVQGPWLALRTPERYRCGIVFYRHTKHEVAREPQHARGVETAHSRRQACRCVKPPRPVVLPPKPSQKRNKTKFCFD
jgi:hypothetical protein